MADSRLLADRSAASDGLNALLLALLLLTLLGLALSVSSKSASEKGVKQVTEANKVSKEKKIATKKDA